MKKSQRERVITKLNHDGYITRNECLRNFITRLGAIIVVLEKEGWEFSAGYTDDKKDYKYKVVKTPFQTVRYFVPELGKEIISYK